MTVIAFAAFMVAAGSIGLGARYQKQAARQIEAAAWSLVAVGESLTASAQNLGLSSQRLIAEASLLNVGALRRDAGLPVDRFEFLEGDSG